MNEFDKIIEAIEDLEKQKKNFLIQNGLHHDGYDRIIFISQKIKCHIEGRDVNIFFEDSDYSHDYIFQGQSENILIVSSWGEAYVFELKNVEFI